MTIEYLYPEICNLYGDSFNIRYLRKILKDAVFVETNLKSEPYFAKNDVDMIYLGATTEEGQEMIIERLLPLKNRLEELITGGKVILCTGNTLEVFGEKILSDDGSEIAGLGIFKTTAKREMLNRYNSIFLGQMEGFEVVGFKSQFSHSYGNNADGYVMKAVKGCGLNPETDREGIRHNNFIGTYVIGPILLLNPPFVRYLLGLMGAQGEIVFEEDAMKAYEVRLNEYHRPDIKLES